MDKIQVDEYEELLAKRNSSLLEVRDFYNKVFNELDAVNDFYQNLKDDDTKRFMKNALSNANVHWANLGEVLQGRSLPDTDEGIYQNIESIVENLKAINVWL